MQISELNSNTKKSVSKSGSNFLKKIISHVTQELVTSEKSKEIIENEVQAALQTTASYWIENLANNTKDLIEKNTKGDLKQLSTNIIDSCANQAHELAHTQRPEYFTLDEDSDWTDPSSWAEKYCSLGDNFESSSDY